MKADPDEMIENPDEGLQVPEEYLEVYWKSHHKTRSFSFLYKQKWKSFILPQQIQNKACFAEHGTPVLLTISCCPVAKSQFASY